MQQISCSHSGDLLAAPYVKILSLSQHWSHMGAASGFPLAAVLSKACDSIDVNEYSLSRNANVNPLKRVTRKLRLISMNAFQATAPDEQSSSPWSTKQHSLVAHRMLRCLVHEPDVLLLLPAADDQFCYEFASAKLNLKRRIFTCFHQSPAWYRLHWRRSDDFHGLGGIVCLSEYQASYFRSITPSPVYTIRHGVRHEFFAPPMNPLSRKGNRLIFVGQWLRDFETLVRAMQLIWRRLPDVHLNCVIPRFARQSSWLHQLALDQRVSWHSNLTDTQLQNLYQSADLLFLPVIDAVANNAVLEALASGLPVVSTRVGAMAEYVPSSVGTLCPPADASAHADAVISWLSDIHAMLEAGNLARNLAVEFHDWDKIGIHLSSYIMASFKGAPGC